MSLTFLCVKESVRQRVGVCERVYVYKDLRVKCLCVNGSVLQKLVNCKSFYVSKRLCVKVFVCKSVCV